MSILQEILTWSNSLPDWQSDAILRLFIKQNLDPDDIEDLYALLKSEHGIKDPKQRKARRLTEDLISVPSTKDIDIKLLGMKNLVYVNALAENQQLVFSPTGITVIYGDNGSGKSGYSRVLKQACRARDQTEQIYSDLNLPQEQRGTPEATFEIEINGQMIEERWKDGIPCSDALSAIAIFDNRCARAYLDEEDDFSFVPYGLDIFEGLAKVCNQLNLKIEQEIAQYNTDLTQFSDLYGQKTVGDLIENLSGDTDSETIERLATISSEDLEEHALLERDLKIIDPKEKAELLRLRSQRFFRVPHSLNPKQYCVEEANLIKFQGLDQQCLEAQSAANIAAKKFSDSGLYLPGTGGNAWRILFDAARKFSDEAYPGKPFPYIEQGAKCPLCQQVLDDGAFRLQQFEEYVQQEIEKRAQSCIKELDEIKRIFIQQNMTRVLDEELLTEIAFYDEKLAQKCQNYEKGLEIRFENMVAAFSSHDWTNIACIPLNPLEELVRLASSIDKESKLLENAADFEQRKEMQEHYNELDARIRLSRRKNAVLTAVSRMKHQENLASCLPQVRTNSISLKKGEISEKVISESLADALNIEFHKLGVGDLQVSLTSRTVKGKTLYKLKLNLHHNGNLGDILSEGEQKAIALGSFLAEVEINGGSGGIIFDDPVSSLDHHARERIAKRLVQKAEKRQVIIFTHDIYFLCILMEEAKMANITLSAQSLVRSQHKFGVIDTNLPFEGRPTSARIKFLRQWQQDILKLFKSGEEKEYERQTIDAYRMLRNTWERAVEEVLFREVIIRFRKGIATQRLKEVEVDDSDYKVILKGMTQCSNFSHDKAMMGGIAIPNPDELLEDINNLEDWRKATEERSKKVRERRQ